MTVARVWQTGFELDSDQEWSWDTVGTPPATYTATTSPKTGSRHYYADKNDAAGIGTSFASTTQVRAAFYFNRANTFYQNYSAWLVRWRNTAGWVCGFRINPSGGTVELYVNNSVAASVSLAATGLNTTNTWMHVGVTVKADATSGFASLYVDGVPKLTWSGNTGTDIVSLWIMAAVTTNTSQWFYRCYADDAYIDTAVGEADVAPPAVRFVPMRPNGAGNATQWTPVGAATNWEAVDDDPKHDADMTYIESGTNGQLDLYTASDPTIPLGFGVSALIVMAVVKSTEVGPQVKLACRHNATNAVSPAKPLATSYGLVSHRFTTRPDSQPWQDSDPANTEIGVESVI